MFFVASKILWLLVQPLSLILISAVLGLFLLARRAYRLAMLVQVFTFGLVALVGFTSLGAVMIQPLENRFTRPARPPVNVSTIIVLGGATLGQVSQSRQVAELNAAGDRMIEALALARTYPSAMLMFSGGIGNLAGDGETEAETARRFFLAQGLEPERLILEGESRNTSENAERIAGLLADPGGAVMLVTSAFHMPRSVALFRVQSVDVVPWPTDYRSTGHESFGLELTDPLANLTTFTVAAREWIGLAAYAATGRIPDVFPSP